MSGQLQAGGECEGTVGRPGWSAMGRAAFDSAAPNELAIPAVARVVAEPDRFGTEPLFGEAPPAARPASARPPQPGEIEGQDSLF
ncbi:hypothetical protein [Streptomyces abikoensis]